MTKLINRNGMEIGITQSCKFGCIKKVRDTLKVFLVSLRRIIKNENPFTAIN